MNATQSSRTAKIKQHISGVFDRAAPSYDQVGPRVFSYFGRRLVEIVQVSGGARVLDVATGRGAVLFPASESVGAVGHVIGIDFSKKMVVETTRQIASLRTVSNVEVFQMDAEDLQFPDRAFDFVLCGFAIFFFPQLNRAMSEFRRVLKPNGRIGMTTFAQQFDRQWDWLREIIEKYLPPRPEIKTEVEADSMREPVFDTPDGLNEILREAGFIDVQIFSETGDFIYKSEDEVWSMLWSIMLRGTLETIGQANGKEALEKLRLEVFEKVREFKKPDGFHQKTPVLFGLATNPDV